MHQNRLGPDGGADSKWLRPGAAAACACVAALLIRAACAWLIGPAQPQEIRYITIAQGLLAGDGFVGLDARFPDIIQPPLYPLVLASALLLPVNPLGVARGLSVVMGALLVFPAVILAGRLFGRRAAARAGWLVAVHPMLAHISSVAITESTFALLVVASMLLVWRLAETPVLPRGRAALWYALAGVCLGFSNLTRPEGITYFLAAALVTAVLLGAVRLRVATAGTALLLIGLLVVVIPYVTWVHAKTDQWLLAPKAVLAQVHRLLAEQGLRERWPEDPDSPQFTERAKFSLTADGSALRSHEAFGRVSLGFAEGVLVSDEEGAPLSSPASALKVARKNLEELYLETVKHGYVIPPVLLMLGGVGLVAHPWVGSLRRRALIVLAFFVASFSFILAPLQARFLYVAVVLAIPWMAEGWCRAEAWAMQPLGGGEDPERPGPGRLLTAAIALAVVGMTIAHLPPVIRMAGRQWAAHRELGLNLRAKVGPQTRLMAATPVVSYYAGAGFEVLPYAELPEVLRYARRRRVDYLIVPRAETMALRPQLQSLLSPERPHPGLDLDASLHENTGRAIYCYRIVR